MNQSKHTPHIEDMARMTDIHGRMAELIERAIPMNFRDAENLNDLLIPGQDEAYQCGRERGRADVTLTVQDVRFALAVADSKQEAEAGDYAEDLIFGIARALELKGRATGAEAEE